LFLPSFLSLLSLDRPQLLPRRARLFAAHGHNQIRSIWAMARREEDYRMPAVS